MNVIQQNIAEVNGCWIWQARVFDKDGYPLIQQGPKLWRACRLSYLLHYGYLSQHSVLHTCDNRKCCNPDHLYLGTQAENMRDAVERGRTNTGEKHWNAKLSESDVKQIKFELALGIAVETIAKLHRVSRWCVSNIASGVRWKHLEVK